MDGNKPTAISMQLIRRVHASALRRAVASSSEEGAAEAEAEAVLQLRSLRLDGQNIAEIDNLEPFDAAQELHLAHNVIECIDNLELLSNLRVLSLHHNRILTVENLRHLRRLEVLDLAFNVIDFASLGVEADVANSGDVDLVRREVEERLLPQLPSSLVIIDLRGNPLCGGEGDGGGRSLMGRSVREALLRRLPRVREINYAPVTIAERRAAMNLESGTQAHGASDRTRNFDLRPPNAVVNSALYERWAASDAPRSHSLFVPVQAEFEHETDRTVKLVFRDGDDLDEAAARFCAEHGITAAAEGRADLVRTMTEMIDEPVGARRRRLLGGTSAGDGAGGVAKESGGSGAEGKSEEKEEEGKEGGGGAPLTAAELMSAQAELLFVETPEVVESEASGASAAVAAARSRLAASRAKRRAKEAEQQGGGKEGGEGGGERFDSVRRAREETQRYREDLARGSKQQKELYAKMRAEMRVATAHGGRRPPDSGLPLDEERGDEGGDSKATGEIRV